MPKEEVAKKWERRTDGKRLEMYAESETKVIQYLALYASHDHLNYNHITWSLHFNFTLKKIDL